MPTVCSSSRPLSGSEVDTLWGKEDAERISLYRSRKVLSLVKADVVGAQRS